MDKIWRYQMKFSVILSSVIMSRLLFVWYQVQEESIHVTYVISVKNTIKIYIKKHASSFPLIISFPILYSFCAAEDISPDSQAVLPSKEQLKNTWFPFFFCSFITQGTGELSICPVQIMAVLRDDIPCTDSAPKVLVWHPLGSA